MLDSTLPYSPPALLSEQLKCGNSNIKPTKIKDSLSHSFTRCIPHLLRVLVALAEDPTPTLNGLKGLDPGAQLPLLISTALHTRGAHNDKLAHTHTYT